MSWTPDLSFQAKIIDKVIASAVYAPALSNLIKVTKKCKKFFNHVRRKDGCPCHLRRSRRNHA